jgi:hypothetical protein
MNFLKKYVLGAGSILIIFSVSCVSTPPIYVPNTLNTTLLQEKGEINIGYNKSPAGYDIGTSYAISDNIGLMINGTYLSNKRPEQNRKHKLGEIGIGYFFQSKEHLIGEIFLGAGLGSNLIKEKISYFPFLFFIYLPIEPDQKEEEFVYLNANYIRFFLQPTFVSRKKIFEVGFSLRLCYINFYKIHHSNINFPRENTLLEPVFFIRIGPPVLKFQMQFGTSYSPFENPEGQGDIFYADRISGAGFTVMLNIK